MQRDPGCLPVGCGLLAVFHELAGRDPEAAQYRARARAGADLVDHAEAERQGVTASDGFEPHGLPPEEVERLRREVAEFYDITRAYLARKTVRYLPEQPFYVLGVQLGRWYTFRSVKENRETIHGLATQVAYSGRVWIVQLNRHTARIAKKLKKVPGAELLRR